MARVEIWETVVDGSGRPVSGAEVEVFNAGTANHAVVFADESSGTVLPQPLTTTSGAIPGWLEEGSYDLHVSGIGLESKIRRFNAIVGGNPKLAPGQVTQTELANDSVGPNQIQNGAVGTSELANDSVGPNQIQNGAVGTSELANDSVTAAKIQNNAVGTSKLATNSVTALKIAADSVANIHLQDDAVGPQELQDGAVGSSHIQAGAVGGTELADDVLAVPQLIMAARGAVKGGVLLFMSWPRFDGNVYVWGTGQATSDVLQTIHLVESDFVVAGRTPKLVVRAQVLTNGTAPNSTISIGLAPVLGSGGVNNSTNPNLGNSLISPVTFSSPAANSVRTGSSGPFDFPEDGVYTLCLNTATSTQANSYTGVSAQLYVVYV